MCVFYVPQGQTNVIPKGTDRAEKIEGKTLTTDWMQYMGMAPDARTRATTSLPSYEPALVAKPVLPI
jgi:hypothetical protein